MPASVRRAAQIICVSESTAKELRTHLGVTAKPIHVIPEAPFVGLDSPATYRDVPDYLFMLFVGTFEPRKNIGTLLRAYARYRCRHDGTLRLVLAGRNGWRTNIERDIAQLGLQDDVRVLWGPDDSQLAALYRQCAFLVMPSHYEGFGLPAVEAMAFGKPVVASTTDALREVVGRAGIFVDPGSERELCDALYELTMNAALAGELSTQAFRQAARQTWDGAARMTLSVLTQA